MTEDKSASRRTATGHEAERDSGRRDSTTEADTVNHHSANEAARNLLAWATEKGLIVFDGVPAEAFELVGLTPEAKAVKLAVASGCRGWADVMQHARQAAPAREELCGRLLDVFDGRDATSGLAGTAAAAQDILRKYTEQQRLLRVAQDLVNGHARPDDIVEAAAHYKAAMRPGSAVERLLASRAFNFETPPPKPVPLLSLAGNTLVTPGNLCNILAPPKAGKSALMQAMISAMVAGFPTTADCLGMESANPEGKAVIHLDTEQSRFDHDALIRRAIHRSGRNSAPDWFVSYSVADLTVAERLDALRYLVESEGRKHGGVLAVLIDGVGDLVADPNDSAESFDLVHGLHTIAMQYDCGIVTILHENPGSDGKGRGHLGSHLQRKVEASIRIQKDADGISTVWVADGRHCHLPKSAGVCFRWDEAQRMHVSCGRAGAVAAAARVAKQTYLLDAVFEGGRSYTYMELVNRIVEIDGVKDRAAKNRIKAWRNPDNGPLIREDSGGYFHKVNGSVQSAKQ